MLQACTSRFVLWCRRCVRGALARADRVGNRWLMHGSGSGALWDGCVVCGLCNEETAAGAADIVLGDREEMVLRCDLARTLRRSSPHRKCPRRRSASHGSRRSDASSAIIVPSSADGVGENLN